MMQRDEFEADLKKYKEIVETLNSTIRTQQNEISQKTEKYATLQTENCSLSDQLSQLKLRMEEESSSQSERIAQLEFQLIEKDKEKELSQLQTQLEEVKNEMGRENLQISEELTKKEDDI